MVAVCFQDGSDPKSKASAKKKNTETEEAEKEKGKPGPKSKAAAKKKNEETEEAEKEKGKPGPKSKATAKKKNEEAEEAEKEKGKPGPKSKAAAKKKKNEESPEKASDANLETGGEDAKEPSKKKAKTSEAEAVESAITQIKQELHEEAAGSGGKRKHGDTAEAQAKKPRVPEALVNFVRPADEPRTFPVNAMEDYQESEEEDGEGATDAEDFLDALLEEYKEDEEKHARDIELISQEAKRIQDLREKAKAKDAVQSDLKPSVPLPDNKAGAGDGQEPETVPEAPSPSNVNSLATLLKGKEQMLAQTLSQVPGNDSQTESQLLASHLVSVDISFFL